MKKMKKGTYCSHPDYTNRYLMFLGDAYFSENYLPISGARPDGTCTCMVIKPIGDGGTKYATMESIVIVNKDDLSVISSEDWYSFIDVSW